MKEAVLSRRRPGYQDTGWLGERVKRGNRASTFLSHTHSQPWEQKLFISLCSASVSPGDSWPRSWEQNSQCVEVVGVIGRKKRNPLGSGFQITPPF